MDDALHVQISDHDSYRQVPTPLDQLQTAAKVPILRIYGGLRVPGTRDLAYNVVVHVHNYYPYFYVDCPDVKGKYDDTLLGRVADDLELQLAESFKRKPDIDSDDEDNLGHLADNNADDAAPTEKRFIASVAYCRATPAYGYHLGYQVMLKILLLLSLYKTRLVRLIGEGKVDLARFGSRSSKKKVLPNLYEAHINLFSQFLADYNLYGCCWLEASKCHFRAPVVNDNGMDMGPLKKYLSAHIAHNNILNPKKYPRMSKTVLEIDINPADIRNRAALHERNLHNDLTLFDRLVSAQEIYLSSLRITFDDLKYQCISRGKDETSQLLHELYSQVFQAIGKGGYCEWENLDQLRKLLPYVEKLNGATGMDNSDDYYSKVIKPTLTGTDLPTSFQLVDVTAPLDYYEKVPLLNFRDDLIRWKYYDQLFESNLFPIDPEPASREAQMSFKGNNGNHNIPRAGHEAGNDIIPELPDSSLPDSDSGDDSMPKADNPSQTSELDNTDTQFQKLDMYFLALTQKRTDHQVLTNLSDSNFPLLTQTLHFLLRDPKSIWEKPIPPSLQKKRLPKTIQEAGLLDIDYEDPAYSNKADLHAQPLVFANRKIIVPFKGDDSIAPALIGEFYPILDSKFFKDESDDISNSTKTWQYSIEPPSKARVLQSLHEMEWFETRKRTKFRSQVEPAVTQTNNFQYSNRSRKVERNPSGFLNLTLMHMELHVNTKDEFHPNPKKDPISMIIFCFDNANGMYSNGETVTSIFVTSESLNSNQLVHLELKKISQDVGSEIRVFNSEKELVFEFIRKVEEYDPDILSGYEVNAASWGYLIERFREHHNMNLMSLLSRSEFHANGKFGDRWGYTHTSSIKINGRHVLNIWRLLKSELSLTSYTVENVCFHTLHQNFPKFLNQTLSRWIQQGQYHDRLMLFRYHKERIDIIMRIIDMQEFVLRNVEQSRLIGVDFYSNFYRGSQYKVESILLRIAKAENLLLNSPSKTDVHEMRALDVIPLIMEPDSNFYKSPLVVLDFQSLYPSIVIAYNYCYSTLLGKLEGFNPKSNEIGYMKHLQLPPGIIEILHKNDGLNIAPNGFMFVSSKFRKSIIARMLEEILNMRINMRTVAAAFPEDKELSKLLNSKQLAMKLIANVTYGYTSASFSGRMPNSDIADAIVATGREIMAKSIEMIESSDCGAKVIYGDTDSLFVYFPGKSKEDAFRYGRSLAKKVTDSLPDPIKLKFEKVYHPCVLLAKKRYVGQCYEFEDQKIPKFEAKGIETIRRDGIPAQLKMVGKCLRILFQSKDLSKVKEYVLREFDKILKNNANVKDFCFAKAVRYGSYKNEQYLPPGAIVARNRMKKDPRSEPQYKERVPYLVIRDVAKPRIKDRCYSPEDYIASYSTASPMELDYEYYITRVLIPPLERIFNLIGVKVKEWYKDMQKVTKQFVLKKEDVVKISEHVQTGECFNCRNKLDGTSKYLCRECVSREVEVMTDVIMKWKTKESQVLELKTICRACTQNLFGTAPTLDTGQECRNEDCQTYYSKFKNTRECEHLEQETKAVMASVEMETLQW